MGLELALRVPWFIQIWGSGRYYINFQKTWANALLCCSRLARGRQHVVYAISLMIAYTVVQRFGPRVGCRRLPRICFRGGDWGGDESAPENAA